MNKKTAEKTSTKEITLKETVVANLATVMEFRHTLNSETDRGCALMAAAFLENELEKLLRKTLIGTNKQKDDLFMFNGPLGTFSAKIKIAYASGLLSENNFHDLELIRKIRNDFGHDYKPLNFKDTTISSRVLQLKTHFYEKEKKSVRSIFTNTVLGLLAGIHGRATSGTSFTKPGNVEPTLEIKRIFGSRTAQLVDAILKTIPEDELNSKNDEQISRLINQRFFELSKEMISKAEIKKENGKI